MMMGRFFIAVFFFAIYGAQAIHIQESQTSPKVFVAQDHTYPIIGVSILIKKMGILSDAPGQEGRTTLAMSLLMDHIQTQREKFQKLGMNDFALQMDIDTVITYVVPKEHVAESLKLLFHEMQQFIPTMDRFRSLKTMYIQNNFTPNASSPSNYMQRRLYQLSFPNDPVFSVYLGSYDTIQALNATDFKDFWTKHLAKENIVFSLCGDITMQEAIATVQMLTTSLPEKAKAPQKELGNQQPTLRNDVTVIQIDKPQTHLIFNLKGVQVTHPDYYAYVLMNAALGGSPFTSRLWKKLRDEHGFVYDVTTYLAKYANLLYGMLTISNDHAFEAMQLIKQELKRLKEQGLSPTELAHLKEQALGNTLLGLVTLSGLSKNIIEAYNRKLDATNFVTEVTTKIKAVTLDDVNRIAKDIDPENIQFILVGNPTPSPQPIQPAATNEQIVKTITVEE